MKECKFYAKTKDGIKICYIHYHSRNESKKLIVLFHGFSSSKNNSTNNALMPSFKEYGYDILKFDFRGCGESEGDLEDTSITTGLLDFQACLTSIINKNPRLINYKMILIGSSFGGAVALAWAKKKLVDAVILKSPMLDIYGSQLERRGETEMQNWKKNEFISIKAGSGKVNLKYNYVSDSFNYNFFEMDMKLLTTKISIIHGIEDKIAPIKFSDKFASIFKKNLNYKRVIGGNHHYDISNDFENMIEFILTEFKKIV